MNGCAGEHCKADKVKVVVKTGKDFADFRFRHLVRDPGEEQKYRDQAPNREVDVETPAPRGVFGEGAAKQGTAYNPKLTDCREEDALVDHSDQTMRVSGVVLTTHDDAY